MTSSSAVPQPSGEPGVATAEDGLVILEGPGSVAVTMTAAAARTTGQQLVDAAHEAELQQADSAQAGPSAPRE